MAEAAVLGMIQDLERFPPKRTDVSERSMFEKKIVVLKDMLDFMRDLKMEDRSKLRHFMADLVEWAERVKYMGLYDYEMHYMLENLQDEIKIIKMRMINFVADEKNIGDEEAEEEEEEVVVGLEKDVKQLLDRAILKKSNELEIYSIKGMTGIGKTTLARQVYKAGASKFQRHAWVSISSGTSKKEILMKLIQQMVVGHERDPSLEEMDNRSLQQMLRQQLEGMLYFIVLDNVLEGRELSYILQALPSQGADRTGSKLLLTCRHDIRNSYVSSTHRVKYIHEMNALDSDKSWKLFVKTIEKFTSDENKFTKELERKGREMLKKCGGLPMAIINVARQKAKQRLSGIEWEELFDSIDLSESLKLLELMYHELGKHLKSKFLYLSLFKENAVIREEKLDQIWAANGLDSKGDIGPFQEREGFAHRSILEVVKQQFQKRKYRLNPLLHMISIKKAEEEMGLEILRSNVNSRPSQNARHRVVHCGRDKFNHFTNDDGKKLISLVFHGGGGYLDDTSSSYWESFESLKILDMEDFGVKTLSENIGALIELRYLGLRNNYIQEIPHSLGGLKNLEALDIAQNFMVEVPDIMWEMDSLRDVQMSNVIFRKPLKVDALTNLNSLTYISIYDWTNEVCGLETMLGLQTLGIEEVDENSDLGTLFASLAKAPETLSF
ncbi:disease resistance protein RPP13-like [Salvia hispanica]|uniref:disease resistance protein RPP13-like n=1 Tax=Salvia hispanica TaxID=49212 RepID=UPI0020092686|nr:disease resistance protein RPP13-like [Salvia hispanica]